jgi:hypothetical protein
MTSKSRTRILTTHKYTFLNSQIPRDQETAHHASRIRGCVVVEKQS